MKFPEKRVVTEHQMDPSEDLAGWLKDVGRRTWRPGEKSANDVSAETRDGLVAYLGQLAGREFKTREDIRAYVDLMMAQLREARRINRRRQTVRDTALLLALLASFIQYHFLDINLQIARLPSTVVFVPVEADNTAPHRRQPVSRDIASPRRV